MPIIKLVGQLPEPQGTCEFITTLSLGSSVISKEPCKHPATHAFEVSGYQHLVCFEHGFNLVLSRVEDAA
jgi:hypothetical protein